MVSIFIFSRKEDGSGESRFADQERRPNEEERKLMFSLALQEAIRTVMSHHVYSLTNQTLIQSNGGPIGLKLSGAVGKIFMVSWGRRFKDALSTTTSKWLRSCLLVPGSLMVRW